MGNVQPAEYRADLVLLLVRGSEKVFGVVVEVQLGEDRDKPYTWPAYVANLRARHRCPVCLLVVTVEEAVAQWAAETIDLGPGTQCTPWVVRPSNTPVITELENAKENVELAVLSAIEHARDADGDLVERIATTALAASADIDSDRAKLYLDLVLISRSKSAPGVLEATMNSLGYEYQSDFARRYVAQGRAEIILKLLTLRFGSVTEAIQALVRSASEAQLDSVAERVLTARTLEEVLGQLL